MRGAVFTEHGSAEVIHAVDDLPIPEPGAGEVRLRMRAAALNRLDLWVREGWKGLTLHMPHVTGSDGAGEVDLVGAGVNGFTSGDRVAIDPLVVPPDSPALMTGMENQSRAAIMGEHTSGLAAEYRVVPARNLVKMPDGFAFEGAAAAGLVYVTAWHSLITRGGLKPGESVLIVGAGGGVNTASIQIAKLTGAKVIVVGSDAEKCAKAKGLGADVVIDRSAVPEWSREVQKLTEKRGVDVVVDNVGKATMFDSIRSVRIGGRILVVGNTSGPMFELDLRYIFSKHISIIGSTMGPHQDYVRVMNLVFDGALKPVISEVLPLDEARRGHELLERGDVFGKIVLKV
ncbi:MAG: zinc-binding dehydrogenase [Anaerolineae bacterium]|jgi:NADPH:quinone reductase-like Zn-dependent oxidoreductase|nr:zinc-binding dehydrogenase [Anaerolineae bacterium]